MRGLTGRATSLSRIRSTLAPLRVAAFGRLCSGYTLNSLGDCVGRLALAVLVYGKTGSAMATSALFIAGEFLPAFLAPPLTARVDQYPARASLTAIYLLEAAIFVGLAVLAASFSLLPVLVLAGLDGVLMLTGRGLVRGTVNALLAPRDLLREGNALLNVGFAGSSVAGAALGGLLVEGFGVSTALAVDAASFAAIAGLIVTSRNLPHVREAAGGVLARAREGLRYARTSRPVRLLLGGQSIAIVLFTLIVPIEVIYAKRTLGTTQAGFGLLLSSWGAGVVVGSLLYVAVKRQSTRRLVLSSTLAIGLAYLGMAVSRQLVPACAFSILGGTGNGIQWVAVMTGIQEATPPRLQARIAGLLESAASAMTGVGFFLGGLITAVSSPPVAFAVAGGGVVALVVAGALARSTALPTGAAQPAAAAPPPG